MANIIVVALLLLRIHEIRSIPNSSGTPGTYSIEQKIENDYISSHQDEASLVQEALKNLLEASTNPNVADQRDAEGLTCLDDTDKLCFEAIQGFSSYKRIPDTPDQVNTKFHLYTSSDLTSPLIIAPSTDLSQALPSGSYDDTLPLKILVHEWRKVYWVSDQFWFSPFLCTLLFKANKSSHVGWTGSFRRVGGRDWRDQFFRPRDDSGKLKASKPRPGV